MTLWRVEPELGPTIRLPAAPSEARRCRDMMQYVFYEDAAKSLISIRLRGFVSSICHFHAFGMVEGHFQRHYWGRKAVRLVKCCLQ